MHRDRVIPAKKRLGDSEKGRRGEEKDIKRFAIARKVRWFFIVFIGGILANGYYRVFSTKAIYDGPLKSVCVPFLNCHACPTAFSSCPVGILQSHAATRRIPLFLTGFLGTVGMTVGRASCGWLCPFGWVQDTLYKIRCRKFSLPGVFLKGKYLTLAVLAVLLPFFTDKHWFSWLCPWGTIQAGIPWVLWNPVNPFMGEPSISAEMIGWHYALKIGVLVFFLVLFVLIKRPFCRTACPLGAIYALFNRASFLQMRVEGECNDCGLCRKVCPMDIHIAKDPKSPECIRCLECTVCRQVRVKWGAGHD
jgi:ferredoxin-type protein NapH